MEETFNIKNFVDFLNTLDHGNTMRIYFNDVIYFYQQSLGGCSCNRKSREDTAETVFVEKVINTNVEHIQIFKKNTNLKLVNFIRRDGFIFKTF